jgi:glycyl-tRNA synthetase beta chain
MADFLLEIGLDEVPARMIAGAEAELGRRVNELLTRERLLASGAKLTTYSTPRRLAVLVSGVLASQADTEEKLTGPSWKVAFKDGAPTAAAEAFAKKAGVAVAALEKVTNAKGEYVGATVKRQGRAASELLAAELPKEVLSLYWAKNMYWRAGKPERFVRPVRWVVALLDAAIVPLEIAGIKAGNASRGHRVLHGEKPVVIDQPSSYAEALRKAFVVVDVAERRQSIRKALDTATRTVAGARWREDDPLIETVVHLTEWPTVVLGDFEPEYLALPEEVLVTVMRDHQKYFAVEGKDGKVLPHFLAVLNTEVDEEGEAIIRHGNARVLRARFKDARFFWDFDQKIPLTARVVSLKNVTFQKELGSYHWKTEANLAVARELAASLKVTGTQFDEAALLKAVELAKTDLTTELVKEFTELQGVIGGLYAHTQGLGEAVAQAIYTQYTPASTEDVIPETVEGQLLGLPTAFRPLPPCSALATRQPVRRIHSRLRRAANAIVKILAESGLPLTLGDGGSSGVEGPTVSRLRPSARAAALLPEGCARLCVRRGQRGAGRGCRRCARCDCPRRSALTAARASADFAAISAAFKRIKNILRQAGEKGFELGSPKDVTLAPEAQQLAQMRLQRLRRKWPNTAPAAGYGEALATIATLRPAVDAFFDKVMVLDPDAAVRGAHLGLIDGVLRGFSGIADFSEIVTG